MSNIGTGMAMEDDYIMTISEVAHFLKVAEKTVHRMIQRNEIPCAKVGGQWRFMRPVLEDWILTRMKVVPANDIARLIESNQELVPLNRLVSEELIIPDIHPGSVQAVLEQLIHPLQQCSLITDEKQFLARLIEREGMFSTAIGTGIAFPHVRNPKENEASRPTIVIGICHEGTKFNAPDGDLTYILILPFTDSETVHLRLMAKLASIFGRKENIERLVACRNKLEVMRVIMEMDKRIGQ